MKKLLFLLSLLMVASAPSALARKRIEGEKPIVTLRSAINQVVGQGQSFHLLIGGREGEYIDVDCGYGTTEVQLHPAVVKDGAVTGTYVTCNVSPEGVVKIYGNAADIDYFEAEGAYLRSADIAQLTELSGLNLQHNELEALDLTPHTKLQTIQVGDNPFSQASPLIIGTPKPNLMLLDVDIVTWMDPNFNLSAYPAMVSFDAYANESLYNLDPTGCPDLMRLTADVTPLSSLDVTKNAKLQILNVSDSRVTSLDLSGCPMLTQLFCNHDGHQYANYKFTSLDVTHNPLLVYLFCGNNAIQNLDLSKNTQLVDLSAARNRMQALDLSANTMLYNVNIANNDMGFATLPLNPGTWGEYYYQQAPTKVRRSYKVGDVIDLSAKMLREGTATTAMLMMKNEADFSVPLPVDPSLYTYADGKITLNAAIADSVFVAYSNDRFDEATLTTTHFVVKTADTFGSDNTAISFTPASDSAPVSFLLGIDGTPDVEGATPSFDFGDGIPVKMESAIDPADGLYHISAPRTGYDNVKVLLPEGVDATLFAIEGQQLYGLNLSGAPVLRHLTVKGAGLYSLDLTKHRCLQAIELEGNNLSAFSLAAKNLSYGKTVLSSVKLSNNNIATFTFDGLEGLKHFDISHNLLTELDLGSAAAAKYINVSHNALTELSLAKCDGIKEIDLSYNKLTSIVMPEVTIPESMNIAGNCMSLATLPSPSLFTGTYTYAPQSAIRIPAKGPCVDLSQQMRSEAGHSSVFNWFKADGTQLTLGSDYKLNGSSTTFLNQNLGDVYCAITHCAFPQFDLAAGSALTTTQMRVTAMPTDVVANFTTTESGQTVQLSLAAAQDGTTIYFDWNGDGSQLTMYDLTTTYTRFEATTKAGANVKVYAYSDAAPITVFSVTGASMSSIDLSRLTSASTINIGKAGLSSITLPAPGKLQELFLDGNNLTGDLDLSPYKEIYYLSLVGNNLAGEFDLSVLPNLQIVSLANNKLTSVKLNNRNIWALDLSRNLLDSINLSTVPIVEQLGLSGNRLTHLDLSRQRRLKSLYIDQNRFTFSTLPPLSAVSILYVYKNQAPVEVTPEGFSIDLSSEAVVGGNATTYRWFLDEISQDEEGNYVGEELIADEEYTVANGVTTFKSPFVRVLGLMTNPSFPALALQTKITNVSALPAVEATEACNAWAEARTIYVSTPSASHATLYTPSGVALSSIELTAGVNEIGSYPAGIYIIALGGKTFKIAIR